MAWSMGLHIGEHFTEIAAQESDVLLQKRFFTAQMAPEVGLNQFFAEHIKGLVGEGATEKIGHLELSTSLPWHIVDAHHGSAMAVLTTAGFEHWLDLTQPFKTTFFSTLPERPVSLFDAEFVFGITERINAEGHIEKLLDEAELEFLCSKLELHQIKNIAIGFLHAHKNDVNETRALKYLEAKGYNVYISSQFKDAPNEKARFWTTILNTYCRTLVNEKLQKISDILTPLLATPEAVSTVGHSLPDAISGRLTPFALASALTDSLSNNFARVSPFLYCGIEDFIYLPGRKIEERTAMRTEYGPLYQLAKPFARTMMQPLTTLGSHFLSPIAFRTDVLTFDPGPIVFGRGMTPTFFDLLSTRPNFVAPAGALEKMNERGRTRLNENMVAYARSSSDKMNIPADSLISSLLQIGGQKLRDELISLGATKECQVAGPLAPAIAEILSTAGYKAQVVADEFIATKSLLISGLKK
jgi:N-methylhydantoinase A